MPIVRAVLLPVLLLTAMSYAQQDQQAAPPPGNQSSYPSTTHKMTPAEKKDTPSANGQPVDLNSASKKDLAGPARSWSGLRADHHRCSSFQFKRRFAEEESHSSVDLRQDSRSCYRPGPEETVFARRPEILAHPAPQTGRESVRVS